MSERKLRVFLCHASQDKPIVRELYQRFIAEGWIDPWLDEEKLLPGQDWDLEIEKAVEDADAVIVFLSNESVTKEGYIQRELRFALDVAFEKPEETIYIIPLRLEECQPPRRLRSWHYSKFTKPKSKNSAIENKGLRKKLSPAHTPKRNHPVLLHISDLQFGPRHAFSSADPTDPKSLCSSLLDDIQNNYRLENLAKPNFIVISGDIANTGMPEEYEAAHWFLVRLCEQLEIARSHVVLIPGNHDVNFLISEGISKRLEKQADGTLRDFDGWREDELYSFRLAPFERFYNRFYEGKRIYVVSRETNNTFSTYDFADDFSLVIVGFDSCSNVDHENHSGSINFKDILRAENEISAINKHFRYKVAVWHHNITSYNARNDFVVNWGEVQEYLFRRHNYSLGLHGHLHRSEERYSLSAENGCWVLGAGAVGVQEIDRAGDSWIGHMPLSYNLVQLGYRSTNMARVVERIAYHDSTGERLELKWRSSSQKLLNLLPSRVRRKQ